MPRRSLRYWDANAFIGWLAQEDDKVDHCRAVIRAAEKGSVMIVTSAVTITEVIKLKRKQQLPQEKWEMVDGFFRHNYISVRSYDFAVAVHARQLIWEANLSQNDAAHVATALRWDLKRMDTFDGQLIDNSKRWGDLVIGQPDLPMQGEML